MRKITFLMALITVFWVSSTLSAFAIATEPTTSPSSFAASPLQQTVSLTFTAGTGNKSLVVYSTSNNVSSFPPTDGVTYAPGSSISAGYTVGYASTTTANASNTIVVTGLSASTTYYFAIYPYADNAGYVNNSVDGSENYRTISPLTGNTTTTSYTTDAMKFGVAGTWETAANWLTYNSGTSGWDISAVVPATTTPTTVTATYEPIVTTFARPWISPSGIYMENGASLSMKPGGATTYATSPIGVLDNITIDGNGGAITLKNLTNFSNGSSGGVVNYRPGITNVSSVTYNLVNPGTYKSSNWTTCFNPTSIPNNCQLYVTSPVTTAGSAGFAISNDAILSSTKVNLGDGVRLLRQYNGNSAAPYTTTVIGELSGSANSTLEGQFVSGRYLYYYIGTLNTDATFNGKLKNYNASGDNLNIYKKGTGTWTLTADSHSGFVTGLFNVDAGKVVLGASASLGGTSVPVTVASGATLQGTFGSSIYGVTTINGTLKGSFVFNSNLTLGSTGVTHLSVNGYTTAGTDYDYLNASGLTVTNGGTLNITINALPSSDTSIKLINAGTYSGSFTTVSIKDGSGNTPVGFAYNPTTGTLTYSLAAPTVQTSNFSVSNILQTSVNLSWTNGDGSKNMVLYSTNSDVATAYPPQDNTTYTVGSTTSSGYIVGAITGSNSATISGLTPGTQYYFAVFGFNDYNTTGMERYLRTSPASGNSTTAPNSNATDNFRTKVTSGRWDAITTWESSSDGNSWYPATMIPQSNSASTLIKANANPITIGGDILPTSINTEEGAKLKISRVFNSTNYTFAPTITGTGAMTIQLDTVPNAKPYVYEINPGLSGITTVNYDLRPIGDAVGIRVVGGGANYNVKFGGSTSAPMNTQFNVTTNKTAHQGFPIANDNYLINSKIKLGNYINLTRCYAQESATNIYIGELSTDISPTNPPVVLGGISTATNRPLSYYVGSLNTDATFSGQFSKYGATGYSNIDVHKVGSGVWTLTGTANANHSGSFFVDEGTLTLSSSILGLIPVIVAGNATLTVSDGSYLPSSITVNVNNTNVGKLNIPNGSTITNFTIGSTSAPEVGTTLSVFNTTDPSTIVYTNTPVVPVGYSYNTSTGVITYNGSSTSVASDISTLTLPTDATVEVSEASLNVDQNAKLRSLTLVPGTKLDIALGKTLTLSSLKLESNSTNGTATFVNSGTAAITSANVQQYLSSGRNWYVSSPVTAATAATLLTGAAKVYKYDEQTAGWVELASGDALLPGTGYITQANATGNVAFTGTLNDGNVQTTVSRLGTTKAGFNLVGNPYPSYLNWKACIEDADNVANAKVSTTVWYRTKTAGGAYTFATYNATSNMGTNVETLPATDIVTGNIPPMQAFWVRVNEGQTTGTLTFKNAMRAHKGSQVQGDAVSRNDGKLRAPALQQVLRLQVSNGINSDEAIILFNNSASNSLDMYDSYKMSNNSASIPEIYTSVGSENLVINGLQSYDFNTVLPLGFKAGETNQYVISASQISNFDTDTKIYLRDNATGTQTDLTVGDAYSFTSDATATDSRFSVLFRSAAGTTDLINAHQDVKVYAADNQIFVENSGSLKSVSAEVFNAVGQKVYNQLLNSDINQLSKEFASGAYVVKINDGAQAVAYKLIVR